MKDIPTTDDAPLDSKLPRDGPDHPSNEAPTAGKADHDAHRPEVDVPAPASPNPQWVRFPAPIVPASAVRAFLMLPGLDRADGGRVLSAFADRYVGRFPDMPAAVAAVTDADHWQHELDAFAADQGLTGFVALDWAALTTVALEMVDVVTADSWLYVFWKK